MTWVKLDDQFYDHPKCIKAGRDGRDLFIAGLCFCASQLTDGRIETDALPLIAFKAGISSAKKAAESLVAVGLWERTNTGYVVHDYLQYNPSAEKVKGEREAAKARMTRIRSGEQSPSLQDKLPITSPDVRPNKTRSAGEVRNTPPPTTTRPLPVVVEPTGSTTTPNPQPSDTTLSGEYGKGGGGGGANGEGVDMDLEALDPGTLLTLFRQLHPDCDAELATVLSQAKYPPRSQAAYLRPHLLRRLRGEEPAPVPVVTMVSETNGNGSHPGGNQENDRRTTTTVATGKARSGGNSSRNGTDEDDYRYPTAAEIADGKYTNPLALVPR